MPNEFRSSSRGGALGYVSDFFRAGFSGGWRSAVRSTAVPGAGLMQGANAVNNRRIAQATGTEGNRRFVGPPSADAQPTQAERRGRSSSDAQPTNWRSRVRPDSMFADSAEGGRSSAPRANYSGDGAGVLQRMIAAGTPVGVYTRYGAGAQRAADRGVNAGYYAGNMGYTGSTNRMIANNTSSTIGGAQMASPMKQSGIFFTDRQQER